MYLRNRLVFFCITPQLRIVVVVDEGPFFFRIITQVIFSEGPVAPFDERPRVLKVAIDGLDRFASAILLYLN